MPLDPSKFDPTKYPRNRSSAQEGVQVAMEWCAIVFVGMLAVLFLAWALKLHLPDNLHTGIGSGANPPFGDAH
jgi:hypothetical protein